MLKPKPSEPRTESIGDFDCTVSVACTDKGIGGYQISSAAENSLAFTSRKKGMSVKFNLPLSYMNCSAPRSSPILTSATPCLSYSFAIFGIAFCCLMSVM